MPKLRHPSLLISQAGKMLAAGSELRWFHLEHPKR